MEVAGGNDGALAAGIAVAAMMQIFLEETSHVGTDMVDIVLVQLNKIHTLPNQDTPGRGERLG